MHRRGTEGNGNRSHGDFALNDKRGFVNVVTLIILPLVVVKLTPD